MNAGVRAEGQVPEPNDMQATPMGTAAWVCAIIEMPENTVLHVVVGFMKAKVIEVVVPAETTSAPTNILVLDESPESALKSSVVGPLTVATCCVPTV